MAQTYKIVRFYRSGRVRSRNMGGGLTLQEAQAHCQSAKTKAADGSWFEGYTAE